MTILFYATGFVVLCGIAFMALALRAEEGYQDSEGFHYGKPPADYEAD